MTAYPGRLEGVGEIPSPSPLPGRERVRVGGGLLRVGSCSGRNKRRVGASLCPEGVILGTFFNLDCTSWNVALEWNRGCLESVILKLAW